ncbi:MAG: serine/threonine-protein kinase [Polyangiaceae bacterium]|jgi:serine/threonine-protein kinase
MKSAASTKFRIGERVPGTEWIVRGVVGRGGMGTVYEVGKGQNIRAAMKVLHPALARSSAFEERFQAEVEVLARLRHPNIVWAWDCGLLSDGCPFFLMELLTGRNLRAVMRDKEMGLTAEVVWKIIGQVCVGLAHAHRDHPPVVHRDVKPENVFLHGRRYGESTVKLLDFGIATVLDATRSAEEVVGTPRYMAPEVLRKEPVSAKVDLYALAVVVYELLTNRFPWRVDLRSLDAVRGAH